MSENNKIISSIDYMNYLKRTYKAYIKKGQKIKKLTKKDIKILFQKFGVGYRYKATEKIRNLYNTLIHKITIKNARIIVKYIGFKKVTKLTKQQLLDIIKPENILRGVLTAEEKQKRQFNKMNKIMKQVNEYKPFEYNDEIKQMKKAMKKPKDRFKLVEDAFYTKARVYKDSWLKKNDNMDSKYSKKSGRYSIEEYYSKTNEQLTNFIDKLTEELNIYKAHLRVVIRMYKPVDNNDHDADDEVEFEKGMMKIMKDIAKYDEEDPRNDVDNLEYSYYKRTTINMTINELDDTFRELFQKTFVELLHKTVEDEANQDRKNPEENKQPEGSGWEFDRVEKFQIHIAKYEPIKAGNYIKLPSVLAEKQCIINVDNSKVNKNGVIENDCFKWAFLSSQHYSRNNSSRVTSYLPFVNKYNWEGLEYPVKVEHIRLFEKNNNVNINVYQLKTKKLIEMFDFRAAQENTDYSMICMKKYSKGFNIKSFNEKAHYEIKKCILNSNNYYNMYQDFCDKDDKIKITPIKTDHFDAINLGIYEGHYVWIKNFNGLFRSKNGCHQYRCPKCCYNAANQKNLNKHIETCVDQGIGICEMPRPDKAFMKFKNIHKMLKQPGVIYADFESSIINVNDDSNKSTKKINKHLPNSFGLIPITISEKFNSTYGYTVYREDENSSDCVDRFCMELKKLGDVLMPMIKGDVGRRFTNKDTENYKNATECYLCKEPFEAVDPNNKITKTFKNKDGSIIKKEGINKSKCKVWDHCHVTGKYRGAAHGSCNIALRKSKRPFIPVVMHNLKGYDAHLIMQKIGTYFKEDIQVIAKTDENYLTFSVGHFRFIDSFSFLSMSLDKLANLLDKKNDFKILEKNFKNQLTVEQMNILKEKGLYPYEWVDDKAKFKQIEFPHIEAFYSKLNDSKCKPKEYERGQEVYKLLNCKNFGDYHDIYLKTDVLILADVCEKFREISLKDYRLDPFNYVSLPSFSWDCMLLKTGVKLDLITEKDMYEFFESNIRGGISMISGLRYAKANNKYMTNYDKSEKSSFITYLDANNLYGWAMSNKLPISNFKWIDEKNLNIEKLKQMKEKGIGFTVEVDIDYPIELHDLHNDYPLLAESKIISNNMLSKYQLDLKGKYYSKKLKNGTIKINESKVAKLICSLNDKRNYVIHSDTLLYALSKGLKLIKIHRGVQYEEESWLEPYIRKNSKKRSEAKNDFEKDFYKLMNNSCYGMTLLNTRKFSDNVLCNNAEKFDKLIRSHRTKSWTIFNQNLVMVNRYKKKIMLDRPIYAGFAVLEYSKLHMQKFHYDYIKAKYGDKANLLFSDTDSLSYYIETEDLYQDMYDNKDEFDLSNFRNLNTLKEPSKYQGKFDNYVKENYKNVYMIMDKLKYVNKFYCGENKAIIGKFKDETAGVPITEFVGLASKCYSLTTDDGKSKATAKGVKKCVKDRDLKHQLYKDIALGKDNYHQYMVKQYNFRSEKHQIFTCEQTKIGLSAMDDKRYLIDPINSLSFGHYKIPK